MSTESNLMSIDGSKNGSRSKIIDSITSLLMDQMKGSQYPKSITELVSMIKGVFQSKIRSGEIPSSAPVKALRWIIIYRTAMFLLVTQNTPNVEDPSDHATVVYRNTLLVFNQMMAEVRPDITHAEFSALMYVLTTTVMDYPSFSIARNVILNIERVETSHVDRKKLTFLLAKLVQLTMIGVYREVVDHNIGGKKMRSIATSIVSHFAHHNKTHITRRELESIVSMVSSVIDKEETIAEINATEPTVMVPATELVSE